jgi:hypothetical protein
VININKDLSEVFWGILFLIIFIILIIKRKEVAPFVKQLYFGVGKDSFWENFILVFAPVGIIVTIVMIYSGLGF